MYAVGRIGSYISRGVDTVAAPFHPFGGAVDMIVVRQADGSLKSSPWYVRFGKFQGVLKTKEKVVNITVNGVDADFHMYLDHKGEAYFLNEVNVEEENAVLYHSSSGEDTDKQSQSKRLTKSDSFNTEVQQPNSARQADGRDEYKREVGAWSNSRRARILGLVFGSRSFKEKLSQESPEDEELKRARLLERAEIAADLLELKWSTTLATKRPKNKKALNAFPDSLSTESNVDVVIDKDQTQVRSIDYDKMEHDNDNGELAHVFTNAEQTSELKSPMKYSVFVAQESSDSLEIPGTNENAGGIENDLCSGDPDRSNVILDANSVIGIQLVSTDSVDTEIPDVIHPTDVVISRTYEDKSAKVEEVEVLESFTCPSSSCSSCISEEEAVEPDVVTSIDQSCYQTNDIDSHNIKDGSESCPDSVGHQLPIDNARKPSVSSDEDQFCLSDFDNSKITKVHHGESESPKDCCNIYESFSSSDSLDQQKMPNPFEEHFTIPMNTCQQADETEGRVAGSVPNKWPGTDQTQALDLHDHCHSLDSHTMSTMLPNDMSSIQKSDDLSKSDKNASFTEGVSPEPLDMSDKPWGIWPFTFKRSRSMKSSKPVSRSPRKSLSCNCSNGTSKQDSDNVKCKPKLTRKKMKTVTPTSEQLASLNLKEGRNDVTFTFSTAMLGDQQVDARIYVWKWNARIVISDVDGTITRSDVLGQVMPLVGVDWSHIGVTQLFSAIKENGYQLLFLSARAISQAYHTRQFLFNLKQNGQPLPDGPVVISPDGLFPSLFREVIRRAPHEFKIACLEDIKACFPADCNPFYAGFGNRDTDEFSYLKVGIPKGKIFIINPKGEVAVHRRLDTKSYTSLHALVNGIFPPTSSTEQEDFNSWNFWKLPPPSL
ncbi:hypothetical protein QQ045_024258 [Rhodiola kirilowii]